MLKKQLINNFFSGLSILGLLVLSPGAWAGPLHSVILSVPDHPEEALTWCGPATAQMIMEGYPSGACSVLQEDIWTAIQTYKAETMWDTDPAGMKGAMRHLCPPVGTWSVHAKTDPQALMYDVALWMSRLNYPAAGLLNTLPHNSYAAHAEHWVAIRGIITDMDPRTNPVVNLLFVYINDPAVALGEPSIERFISGSTWYAEFQPVTKPASSYFGKYVAVIEPPVMKGRAVAPAEIMKGNLITPERAIKYALKWIEEYKLYQIGPYKLLKRGKPLSPLLVNKGYGGYYIIPFTEGGENRPAGGAVLINAYTGGLQEAGVFKHVSYMSEKQARTLALRQLKVKKPKEVSAELILPMKERLASRYFPLWKVMVDGRTIGVTQQGQVLTRIPRE
jgi:hypothetical protein